MLYKIDTAEFLLTNLRFNSPKSNIIIRQMVFFLGEYLREYVFSISKTRLNYFIFLLEFQCKINNSCTELDVYDINLPSKESLLSHGVITRKGLNHNLLDHKVIQEDNGGGGGGEKKKKKKKK